ncbi:c-type cytochrome [Rosenbergiella sp. S61]|uniref:C-type cytochrome n=1 Tax=Rosenbergiella gaditana TaxID=2726987 RepID=A0ABS5SX74_9GAMM|nr:cytochrome c [Rosenbergiella gaditana]MBT0724700.1 c-type cytochrome [Rosenbergiella gaditana]
MKKFLHSLLIFSSIGWPSLTLAAQADYDLVEKGRYLTVVGDCSACHTAQDSLPYAGGVPIHTPFGDIIGANITPDNATGIGKWNFDQFQAAMREGHGREGKKLYPAMPYTAYTKVSDQDLYAIWSYLRALQPIHNRVESNQLPFPFNIRSSLLFWNWINFKSGTFIENSQQSAQWNRGAYLVEGLGHCGTCHTAKNLLGGDKSGQALQGAVVDNWWAPNITNNNHQGLGRWTIDEIKEYLRTGANKYDFASGPMAEEVKKSSQYWHEEDLHAVAVYLKTLDHQTPIPTPLSKDQPAMRRGSAIYFDRCSACHLSQGEGAKAIFPQLANNPLINASNSASLIRVVLAGSRAVDTDAYPTGAAMPAFAKTLTDQQIADVITWIRNSWGNSAEPVKGDEVRKVRDTLSKE